VPTLVITINGPFAYVDNTFDGTPGKGYLTLMAPMCPQHAAGIASIEAGNQYILPLVNCRNHKAKWADCSPHRYHLCPNLSQLNATPWNSQKLLRPVPAKPFDPKEWRFWLTLPRPDCFAEINPVKADIIRPETNDTVSGNYAIGVRLIYNSWDGNDIPLLHEGKPAQDPNGNPFAFKFSKTSGDFAFLELDYASPLRDDRDHEDAVDCFENLMTALGFHWSIFIPPLISIRPNLEASKLNDCKAAVAWVD
jgi:hypothetical protein